MTAAELLDEGIRAYTRGDFADAERCWTEVLALEPNHSRARSYLELLGARAARQAGGSRRFSPPMDGARFRRPSPQPEPAAVEARPPAAPSWLQPPSGAAVAAPGRDATPPDAAASPWDEEPSVVAPVVIGDGDGLDLSTVADRPEVPALVPEAPPAPRPRTEVEVWMEGARELFALGDFSGSLEMLEKILRVDPGHAEAREYLRQNEATLIAMYESKLGAPTAVPRLAIRPEEVMWLNLDHRAGFLLAQIDGTVSYEDLFALSGLPRLDTARILAALLGEGVIRS